MFINCINWSDVAVAQHANVVCGGSDSQEGVMQASIIACIDSTVRRSTWNGIRMPSLTNWVAVLE